MLAVVGPSCGVGRSTTSWSIVEHEVIAWGCRKLVQVFRHLSTRKPGGRRRHHWEWRRRRTEEKAKSVNQLLPLLTEKGRKGQKPDTNGGHIRVYLTAATFCEFISMHNVPSGP